ncbi:MAG TPA: flavin reductase family protein [Candidatus Janibacter merdipullorum]|nr:flavin reductase family protein [Candidatus Janibacter merdipullorum]
MSITTVSPPDVRAAFRAAAASAWVVTGHSADGPVGFTAISVVSVSVDPPLVSFNISKSSSSLATVSRSRRAALHLLGDEQAGVARRFAGDRARRYDDDGSCSIDDGGLPRIHGVVSRLVVEVVDLVDAGDSYIAVGRVESTETTDREPLVHHAGTYLPRTPSTTTNGA